MNRKHGVVPAAAGGGCQQAGLGSDMTKDHIGAARRTAAGSAAGALQSRGAPLHRISDIDLLRIFTGHRLRFRLRLGAGSF